MTVHADLSSGLASTLFGADPSADPGRFKLLKASSMVWAAKHENSSDAQAALAGTIPLFILLYGV